MVKAAESGHIYQLTSNDERPLSSAGSCRDWRGGGGERFAQFASAAPSALQISLSLSARWRRFASGPRGGFARSDLSDLWPIR